jgi:tetratricopeptide (TPR) repeat protein
MFWLSETKFVAFRHLSTEHCRAMAYQSEIEKLEQRYHENPQQWFAALADSYRKAGDLDLAVEVVRGGLEKRPNYASGHIVLGRCLLDMQKTVEAAAAFQQVLELDGENIIALKSLGEIAEQQGDISAAKDWLGQLLEVDPMNDEARESLERLSEIVIDEPEVADILPEQPSIEPGAAWAAEAMADINRGAEEAVATETASSGPEATPNEELSIERTSWDGLHGSPKPDAAPEPGVAAEAEIDAAFEEETAVEPVSGLVDASFQEPGAVEPVSGLVGAAEEVDPGSEGVVKAVEDASVGSGRPEVAEGGEVKMAGDLEVVSFDDELSWDAGEERSSAISENDIQEASVHQEDLAPAVEFLGDPDAFGKKTPEGPESAAETPAFGPGEAADESQGMAAAGGIGRGQDLPLIMPDADQQVADGVSADGSEAEPVVTETMAEVYARQGLFEQARETYEKLLLQRPGDPGLERKLAEVSNRVEASSGERASRFDVADTGGQSAVAYLRQLFSAASQLQVEGTESAGERSPDATATPHPESALRSAFGGEPAEPPGAPTIPASDEVSLSSVFGGETPPSPPPSAAPSTPQAASESGGVSFDQFYGADKELAATDGAPSEEEGESEEGADDEFRNWLEGLKT